MYEYLCIHSHLVLQPSFLFYDGVCRRIPRRDYVNLNAGREDVVIFVNENAFFFVYFLLTGDDQTTKRHFDLYL